MSDTGHEHSQQHPIGLYLKIWGLLFVLSAMSYAVDYFHLQGMLRWTLILVFMMLKAGLIVAVFMHMAWERLALIYAILLPPLGVYLHEGEVNTRFWISLLLTLLFFIPGVIYALIVVLGD